MDDTDSKKRERSPNFPFIGLAIAIDRARQFYEQEKRGSAAISVTAKHWGYSEKSSGVAQTIAALKSYGLLDDEGRGDARRVRLTERALRILLDSRPDSKEREEAIRQASLSPALCMTIADKFQDDFPSDANLEHFLLFDLKFNPESARAAVKIVKENNLLTKYLASDSISVSEESYGDKALTPGAVYSSISIPQLQSRQIPIQGGATERIIGPSGEIVLQWSGDPTWESYDFLEDYIKLRKKVLKQGALTGNQQDKD